MTGHSGSGKSAIIQHIALKYRQQGWIVKLVNEVKEILNLYPFVLQDKTIFVLNDPIGKRCFDEISYNSWEAHENSLKVCLKKCKLLLSSRKYILRDDRVTGLLKETTNIVDIDDDQLKLNSDEKQRIWNIYASNKKLSKEELAEIFKIEEYFPLLCKLYFLKQTEKKERILMFFKEPIAVFEEDIRSFRKACKEKYCALVLLVLFDNSLDVHTLHENKSSREKFKLALELCGMQENTAPYDIGDTLESLEGSFVKKIGDTYQFYHDFVTEVTTLVFGTDYPTVAIKYADVTFLRKRVKIKSRNAKNDLFTIFVSDKHISELGKRLYIDLFGQQFLHVVLNPCMRNENIKKILYNEFDSHQRDVEQLLIKTEIQGEIKDFDHTTEISPTNLSLLGNTISPISALIMNHHTELSIHCITIFKRLQINIKDIFLFSAVCCNGSIDLFNLFGKDEIADLLTDNCKVLYPVHIVSMLHNFEILQKIIQLGEDVNFPTENHGISPLILAVIYKIKDDESFNKKHSRTVLRNKTVKLLLHEGADINLCMKNGVSPLFAASENGYESTVQLLLIHGANINLCNDNGASPLLIACQKGHENTAQTLIKNGADVNLIKDNNTSPLFFASFHGQINTVQLLINNGVGINLCDKFGVSPLCISSKFGHYSTVHLLLTKGADVDLCDENEDSPLHLACQNGHSKVVQLLLSYKAKFNLCNNKGESPLFKACQKGHDGIVKTLLSY